MGTVCHSLPITVMLASSVCNHASTWFTLSSISTSSIGGGGAFHALGNRDSGCEGCINPSGYHMPSVRWLGGPFAGHLRSSCVGGAAVAKNRNGIIGVGGASGKKKVSDRKDTVAVSATKPKIVRKNHNTPHATPLEPELSRGRGVSKKSSIRGKGNHGSILQQPCRYYLKGTCTRTPCEYWLPPECQFL